MGSPAGAPLRLKARPRASCSRGLAGVRTSARAGSTANVRDAAPRSDSSRPSHRTVRVAVGPAPMVAAQVRSRGTALGSTGRRPSGQSSIVGSGHAARPTRMGTTSPTRARSTPAGGLQGRSPTSPEVPRGNRSPCHAASAGSTTSGSGGAASDTRGRWGDRSPCDLGQRHQGRAAVHRVGVLVPQEGGVPGLGGGVAGQGERARDLGERPPPRPGRRRSRPRARPRATGRARRRRGSDR